MDDDVVIRVDRIEKELDDIRETVKANTKNISKLYSVVSEQSGKMSTLIEEIDKQSKIISTVFNHYKDIVDRAMNNQQKGNKMLVDAEIERSKINIAKEKLKIVMYATITAAAAIAGIFGIKIAIFGL